MVEVGIRVDRLLIRSPLIDIFLTKRRRPAGSRKAPARRFRISSLFQSSRRRADTEVSRSDGVAAMYPTGCRVLRRITALNVKFSFRHTSTVLLLICQ